MSTQQATFGAGCFWGVEEAYRKLPGVITTTVGYSGGHVKDPSYERVCEGDTGHAEVVTLTYDPDVVTYEALVRRFFELHDPTQVNRQGPDVGEQYRSVIFTHRDEDKATAEKVKADVQPKFSKPIATAIENAKGFYRAEEYHQQYIAKGGRAACHI
ncbi:MAG: peptide-methionine (S)-S-oxide reductase MsrA [Patescibacteria group bacterium]